MKETDTMQSYKYLQAIFGDKWVDWGVSVGFLLLIAVRSAEYGGFLG